MLSTTYKNVTFYEAISSENRIHDHLGTLKGFGVLDDRLRCWNPSRCQVYCGLPVDRDDQAASERLSAYFLRPGFAGTRLRYQAETGQIQYRTHKGVTRCLDAPDWIKKIDEVDPLRCPHCGHQMQIIAFIEQWSVIRKILQHLNLWEHSPRYPPPPRHEGKRQRDRTEEPRSRPDTSFTNRGTRHHGPL